MCGGPNTTGHQCIVRRNSSTAVPGSFSTPAFRPPDRTNCVTITFPDGTRFDLPFREGVRWLAEYMRNAGYELAVLRSGEEK